MAFPSRDEFIKFLNDKKIRSCEACGVDQWIRSSAYGAQVQCVVRRHSSHLPCAVRPAARAGRRPFPDRPLTCLSEVSLGR
jgi:hypothetical protein